MIQAILRVNKTFSRFNRIATFEGEMLRTFRRLLLTFLFINGVPGFCQAPRQVDFCELLTDPVGFNGISVRSSGHIELAPEGGPWLVGECSSSIEVKGIRFRNIIQLANPASPVGRDRQVDFSWDEGNQMNFWSKVASANAKTQQLRATVEGLFETRVPLSDLVKATIVHPKGLILGFGPGNAAPAQIIVRTIEKITIENKREPSKNDSNK